MHLFFYRHALVALVLPSHPYTCRGVSPSAPPSITSTCCTTASKPLAARLITNLCPPERLTSHSAPTLPDHHLPAFAFATQRLLLCLFSRRNGNLLLASLPRHGSLCAIAAPGVPCGCRGDAVVPGNLCTLHGGALHSYRVRLGQQFSEPQRCLLARAQRLVRRVKGGCFSRPAFCIMICGLFDSPVEMVDTVFNRAYRKHVVRTAAREWDDAYRSRAACKEHHSEWEDEVRPQTHGYFE